MAQKSQGIQTLLEAEKDAAQIIEKARAYRTQRVKDAQSEANVEIEALKKSRAEELEAFESKFAGTESAIQKEIDNDTQAKLAETERAFAEKHDALVKRLVERVSDVDPQAHKNLKKVEA
ncbi:triacylglycerol lipase [Malassezia cuniculi]|uniref:V-type proton ATPase subunit G n=1 Tax=Malassezia cuniculi TaxID=948313 RepID=A0AAF0EUW6_9BASI|nr:triacylglycerol lipase [Malassezia cuniculi]